MIDTIKLKIECISDDSIQNKNFHFSEKYLSPDGRPEYTNNVWRKKEQAKGRYIPKYWIKSEYKPWSKKYLCIELSLPKFLFGENITEIKEHHFDLIVDKISLFIRELDLFVLRKLIEDSKPQLLAIGKNISTNTLYSCDMAIEVLSKFDWKPHSEYRMIRFANYKKDVRELHFNIKKKETFKIYDKFQEILHNARTTEELKIADGINKKNIVLEVLRFELTFKDGRKIKERLMPFVKDKKLTFKNIFQKIAWEESLKLEVNKVFNNPLKYIIFLSAENKPTINTYLEKHYCHIETKDTLRGIIASLQEYGLAKTRKNYLTKYKSHQTWYNYKNRLKKMSDNLNLKELANLESFKIHSHIMNQFGIDSSYQQNLLTKHSNKIDIPPRKTINN